MRQTFVYRPEHPKADQFGFVEKYLSYSYLDDLSATIGNQKISINYIPDEIAPTFHMAACKHFTSKKKFRNETKAYGCVEVGNDYIRKPRAQIVPDKRERREHIKQAIYELRNK